LDCRVGDQLLGGALAAGVSDEMVPLPAVVEAPVLPLDPEFLRA
jgi:hypothetical protein